MHMNRYLPNCQRDSPSKPTDQTLKMLHSNSSKYVFYTFIKCYVPSGFSQVYPHESWNSITPPTLWEGCGAGRVRGSVISSILVGVPQQYTGDWTGCRSFIDMGRARRGQGGGGLQNKIKKGLPKYLFFVFHSLSPLPQFSHCLKKDGKNIYQSINHNVIVRDQNFRGTGVFHCWSKPSCLYCSSRMCSNSTMVVISQTSNWTTLRSRQTGQISQHSLGALPYLGVCDSEAVLHKALELGLEFRQVHSLK